MTAADGIAAEIRGLTVHLMNAAITEDHQWPKVRRHGVVSKVEFENARFVSSAMKHDTYAETYACLADNVAYNAVMLDGAIIQLMYRFERRELTNHRLAFLPRPKPAPLEDMPKGLTGNRSAAAEHHATMQMPLRIDFDASDAAHRPLMHPKCHMTLGQQPDCRIPVSAPLTPFRFMDFLLRSFYDNENRLYAKDLPQSGYSFDASLHADETKIVHVAVPG